MRAVALARQLNFEFSCRPEQGRLLQLLAAGRRGGSIGETGSGCGVGIAWLLSGGGDETSIVSVERNIRRAEQAARLFGAYPNVTIINEYLSAILDTAPSIC
jgi:predicted O-methyltransferase YrrM